MSEEKEFKNREYLVELKCVAILSVDEIDELKEAIPNLIKKRIEHYNYDYLIRKNDSMNTMNIQAYLKCRFSEYNEISREEKDFMNNEVAQVRNNINKMFSDRQSKMIITIYNKKQKHIQSTFNNSEFLKKKLVSPLKELEDN